MDNIRTVELDKVIGIIEDRQRIMCPLGMFGRRYADNKDAFDYLQEIISDIRNLPEYEVTALKE